MWRREKGGRETETVGNILGLKGERGKEGKSALVRRWGRERANPREESEIGTSSTTTGIAGWDFEEDVGSGRKIPQLQLVSLKRLIVFITVHFIFVPAHHH